MGAIRLLSQTASLSNTYPFHRLYPNRERPIEVVSTVSAEGKSEKGRERKRETRKSWKFQRISNSQLFSIATAFDASFVRQRG